MIFCFVIIRNSEKYQRESWIPLVGTFLWGAIVAAGLALVLEELLWGAVSNFFLLSILIAPFIEELLKPVTLCFFKKEIDELEDGLIYGAIAGLGFSATENVIYGLRFWNEGIIVLIALLYIRTLGSGLLHGSATAITGLGYSSLVLKKKTLFTFLPYFFCALFVHSLFNLFSYSALTIHQIIGVVFAVVFAVLMMIWVQKRIQVLDTKESRLSASTS
jgi:RsiW-degrading membrane proteinase PrsW (M82 family)